MQLKNELVRIDSTMDAAALEGRPLVGLGSGVYWLRHDPEVRALADRVIADRLGEKDPMAESTE